MSKCNHSISEMGVACADGLCPICLDAAIARLYRGLVIGDHNTPDDCLDNLGAFSKLVVAERDSVRAQLAGKDAEIARLQTMVKNLEEPETFYRVGEVEHKEALQENSDD
jgi:hypothetical protein